MPDHLSPGVYVEEIPTQNHSVAEVPSAVPAFIGVTQEVPDNTAMVPVKINSLLEYIEQFGKAENYRYKFDVHTGDPIDVSLVEDVNSKNTAVYNLYYALRMFYENGGERCWVVSLSTQVVSDVEKYKEALSALDAIDEATLLVAPHAVNDLNSISYHSLCESMLKHAATLKDRFAILDIPNALDEATASTVVRDFRDNISTHLSYGAAYTPFLISSMPYVYDEEASVKVKIISSTSEEINGKYVSLSALASTDPLVYRAVRAFLKNTPTTVIAPPSAAIAGIYARVDRQRGVWKAPANVAIAGVIGPVRDIDRQEQESLNVDPIGGKSINAIRRFSGRGTLVWGARTLAGNDNEWRYVSVRRLSITMEESIKKATTFAVFEPNNASTWANVKEMVNKYLFELWKDGALTGTTPEDAYFVNVGLGMTMTDLDIREGNLIIELGFAPLRPAEFIILRFTHKMQPA